MEQSVKAVLFDLDGTAVPSGFESRATPRLKQAIKQAQSAGLYLAAATGRSWDKAAGLIGELELTDPCIICGGAIIIDPRTQKILWQATVPVDSLRLIARVAEEYGFELAYSQGLATKIDQPAATFQPSNDINVVYILGVPHQTAKLMIDTLASDTAITVAPADSWRLPVDGVDLHITSSTATKEHAINELAQRLGLSAHELAGVGDGHNDIHLFNAVGRRVAMGNAVPELKSVADEIIGSVKDDGLAAYLRGLSRP